MKQREIVNYIYMYHIFVNDQVIHLEKIVMHTYKCKFLLYERITKVV